MQVFVLMLMLKHCLCHACVDWADTEHATPEQAVLEAHDEERVEINTSHGHWSMAKRLTE